MAAVDSGRCYLPIPKRAQATETGDRESGQGWRITSFQRALFRLLNALSGTSASGNAFDECLQECGIEVTG